MLETTFDKNGNLVKGCWVTNTIERTLNVQFSEPIEIIGEKVYNFSNDGTPYAKTNKVFANYNHLRFNFEGKEVNTTYFFGKIKAFVKVSAPIPCEIPQGMELDKCACRCFVSYADFEGGRYWKIEIVEYIGEITFKPQSVGYSGYGDASERRSGVNS